MDSLIDEDFSDEDDETIKEALEELAAGECEYACYIDEFDDGFFGIIVVKK
jgi:hypothetical protein